LRRAQIGQERVQPRERVVGEQRLEPVAHGLLIRSVAMRGVPASPETGSITQHKTKTILPRPGQRGQGFEG
jgi:hypothetical protein